MTSRDEFDLDELKSAVRAATPAPDAAARAANMALAQENFDRMHGAAQGSDAPARHTETKPRWGLFSGVRTMLNTMTTKGGLTATTAIVAGGFLLLTPMGQDLLRPGPIMPDNIEAELGTAVPDIDFGGTTAAREAVVSQAADAPVEDMVAQTEAEPTAGGLMDLTEAPAAVNSLGQSVEPLAEADPILSDRDVGALDIEFTGSASLGYNERTVEEQNSERGLTEGATFNSGVVAEEDGSSIRADRALDGEVRELFFGATESFPEPVVTPEPNTETFANDTPSSVEITVETPVSTFSIDVDTAAYSIVRQSINAGQLPPADAVRIEEMINYFPYAYAAPEGDSGVPFEPNVTVMDTPWNDHTQLVHIGLQGTLPAIDTRAPLNLVFLIDTSGSMEQANKLPLLRQSFLLMLNELRPEDEVAIVTYAGSAGLALASTPASDRAAITAALNNLTAGGSTNGQGGLEQAYAVAEAMSEDGEVSRVILATDGDFNVGLSDPSALEDFISDQRDSGTYLSVLGFGRGNLDDATMQALAQNGNGIAAYIDTLNEAQKVLVDQLTGALFAIAGDVKIQVEWNPAVIGEYRLIGYETRALAREDFNNDAVDAGELGAGHSVTAIYEVTPVGSPALLNDSLRYQAETVASDSTELGFLRLRWKAPGEDDSQLFEVAIVDGDAAPNTETQFATAIAGFGQLLRDDRFLGDWGWDEAIALANAGTGEDPFGYRREAVQLMRLAQSLSQD